MRLRALLRLRPKDPSEIKEKGEFQLVKFLELGHLDTQRIPFLSQA